MSAWIRRNVVIVVLAAIAVVVLGWYLTRSYGSHRDLSRIAVARARLAACLVGEPVDRRGADQQRIRAIQLAGAPDWPQRCAKLAGDVEAALGPDRYKPDQTGPDLLASGKLFEFYHLESHLADLLRPDTEEPVPDWAQATRGVPLAPAPVPLATETAVLAQSDYDSADTGEHDLVLKVGNEVACRFAANAGGLEPVAHCSYPGNALAIASRSWELAEADGGPAYVVASDGVRAFATGELAVRSNWNADVSIVGGAIYAWPADAKLTTVARRTTDGKQSLVQLPPARGERTLMRDQLIWSDGKRVVAASIAGDKLGPIVEVAKIAAEPVPGGCFTAQTVAVRLKVGDDEYRVAALIDGTWQLGEVGPRYYLQCDGTKVVGLDSDRTDTTVTVRRIDCSGAGCTTSQATLPGMPELYDVTAIGDATMIVWVDSVVRAAVGPLAQLPTVKPVPVFDGFGPANMNDKQTDAAMLVQGVQAFSRGASAIVLLDGDGVQAIHIRDGKPERVQIVFE